MNQTNSAVEVPEVGPFAIGEVAEMTGISEPALRVWERRYGFPQSARTAGGHRHYFQQDVLRLRWVKLQMDAGMRVGRAIRAQSQLARDATAAASLLEPVAPCAEPDVRLRATQASLLAALLAYDSQHAAALLAGARATYPMARVVLDVVGPALAGIGEAWSTGDATVAMEHFASNFLRHQLLDWIRMSLEPFSVAPIVLACAPDELHEGGLLMLAVLLRELRWPVVYLGQTLPLTDIRAVTSHIKPALFVFVAMSEEAALALAEWPRALEEATAEPAESDGAALETPIICYGGQAFTEHPDLAGSVPGTLLGATLCEGFQRLDRLMLHLAVLRN